METIRRVSDNWGVHDLEDVLMIPHDKFYLKRVFENKFKFY